MGMQELGWNEPGIMMRFLEGSFIPRANWRRNERNMIPSSDGLMACLSTRRSRVNNKHHFLIKRYKCTLNEGMSRTYVLSR